MHHIVIGSKGEEKLLVTSDIAISFLELADARVLSTPEMIRWMERTSRLLLLPQLESGHDSVGTHVNVSHLAGAPMGSVVTFTAEILSFAERRVTFQVSARTEDEVIGEGTHERGIINVAKFATRTAAKRKG